MTLYTRDLEAAFDWCFESNALPQWKLYIDKILCKSYESKMSLYDQTLSITHRVGRSLANRETQHRRRIIAQLLIETHFKPNLRNE